MVNIVGIYHTLPRLCGRYAQHTTRKTFAIAAGVPLDQAIPFGEPILERKKVNALSIAYGSNHCTGNRQGRKLDGADSMAASEKTRHTNP